MVELTYFKSLNFKLAVVITLILGFSAVASSAEKLAQLPTQTTDLEAEKLLTNVLIKNESLVGIRVHVDAGIVYIEGSIPAQKDLEWFKDLAHQLPNIVAVVEKIEHVGPRLADLTPIWFEIHKLADRLKQSLPSILVVTLLLILFYFLSGFINRGVHGLWGRKILNPFLLTVVSRLTLLPIWLMLLYFIMRMLGLSALGATLVGGTSLLGIVLGLSFKGIAENYLAGLLLAARSPFTRGDLIIIGQYKGYVQNLNMRGTTIIDFSGNLILIPNLMVIQSVVENQTANPKTRTSFTVGIGYQDSIPKAQDLIVKAVSQVSGVITDPAPSVIVKELGPTRVELNVRVWFDVKVDREMRIKSRAMIRTKETLLANGFSIPNETRELIFTSPLKIENIQTTNTEKNAAEDRKNQVQKQAASNLADPEFAHTSHDPSPEDLLQQAEKNPLPLNSNEKDLLKR